MDRPVALVTASRNWSNVRILRAALDQAIMFLGGDMILRHGACPKGGDLLSSAWAKARGIEEDPMPAQWVVDGVYDREAGFKRNEAMVDKNPRPALCLAFMTPCVDQRCAWKRTIHPSHGASHTRTLAEVGKILTWPYYDKWKKVVK